MELSELQELKARVRKLEERDVENQQLRDLAQDATPEATPPSISAEKQRGFHRARLAA